MAVITKPVSAKNIAIVGGGPASLYFALLYKKSRPEASVTVFEQNPANATYGFGVVFSENALSYLEDADAASYRDISAALEVWPDLAIAVESDKVYIDGNGFSGVGRLELLQILQKHCAAAAVDMHFETRLESLGELTGYDLVIGAGGVNSVLRDTREDAFKPKREYLTNKFVWYGAPKTFDALTLTFKQNQDGAFVAHHYRYSPTMSTFIVECDAQTWRDAGFEHMSEEESRDYSQTLFAEELDGLPLVMNRSIWRNFPVITNANWHADHTVLIGDALRTVHFSIGSGTRLAMEDAIALHKALLTENDVQSALASFEAARRPIVDKLMNAARSSYLWYEDFRDKLDKSAFDLAYDYMTRSGRVDHERLRRAAPKFIADYEAYLAAEGRSLEAVS